MVIFLCIYRALPFQLVFYHVCEKKMGHSISMRQWVTVSSSDTGTPESVYTRRQPSAAPLEVTHPASPFRAADDSPQTNPPGGEPPGPRGVHTCGGQNAASTLKTIRERHVQPLKTLSVWQGSVAGADGFSLMYVLSIEWKTTTPTHNTNAKFDSQKQEKNKMFFLIQIAGIVYGCIWHKNGIGSNTESRDIITMYNDIKYP